MNRNTAILVWLLALVAVGIAAFYFAKSVDSPFYSEPKEEVVEQGEPEAANKAGAMEEEGSVVEETEDLQEIMTGLFSEKYHKPVGEVQLEVNKQLPLHASGVVKFAGEIGGAWWLASKSGGEWQIVADGNGTVECAEIEPFDFPSTLVPECWDSSQAKLIKR